MIHVFYSFDEMSTFDPDSVLRTKLVCDSHKNISKQKTYKSVCPWIYGIDEDTLIKLLDEEISREDIIEIEKTKWFEKAKDCNKFENKYEKVQKVLKIIELQPNSKHILKDIELSWKIEFKGMVWKQIIINNEI